MKSLESFKTAAGTIARRGLGLVLALLLAIGVVPSAIAVSPVERVSGGTKVAAFDLYEDDELCGYSCLMEVPVGTATLEISVDNDTIADNEYSPMFYNAATELFSHLADGSYSIDNNKLTFSLVNIPVSAVVEDGDLDYYLSLAENDGYNQWKTKELGLIQVDLNDSGLPFQIYFYYAENTSGNGKGDLEAAINAAPNDNDTRYYHSGDRYNGKDDPITDPNSGYWAEMQVVIKKAKDVYDNENATQTMVKDSVASLNLNDSNSALSKAIDKLIPIEQANTTPLFEALNSSKVFGGANEIALEDCTQVTVDAYNRALNAAQSYMNSLFDENGSPLSANVNANNDTIASLAQALTDAAAGTVRKELYERQRMFYLNNRDDALALLEQYNPYDAEKLSENDYTSGSWKALKDAYDELSTNVTYHDNGGTKADMDALDAFASAFNAFKIACASLQSTGDIQISFSYIDNYSAKTGGTALSYSVEELTLTSGSTTAKDAMDSAYIVPASNSLYLVFVKHQFSGSNYAMIQLHNGDEVKVIRTGVPVIEIEASTGVDSTQVYTYSASSEIDYRDSIAEIVMTAPETAVVGKSVEFSAAVTGASFSNAGDNMGAEGITLFVSDADQQNSSNATTAITDQYGKTEYIFREPGTYTVAMVNVSNDIPTITDVFGSTTYGTYYSLYAGDFATVTVTGNADAELVKKQRAENLAAAKEYFDGFHDYDFAGDGYDGFQTQYEILVKNQEDATVFKDLMAAYETDFAKLQELGAAALDHASIIAALRADLAYVPSDLAELNYTYQSVVESVKSKYNALNAYQKTLLSNSEIAQLDALLEYVGSHPDYAALPAEIKLTASGTLPISSSEGTTSSAPNHNKVFSVSANGELKQQSYNYGTHGNAPGFRSDAVAYPGYMIEMRRLCVTSDTNYWMVYSVDGGQSWLLPDLAESSTGSGDKLFTFRYTIPMDFSGSALDFALKMVTKAEYIAMTSSSVAETKADALAALQAAYDAYDLTQYDDAGKAALAQALEDGKAAVSAASAIDGVAAARKAAIAAMAAVPVADGQQTNSSYDSGATVGRVFVTIENTTWPDLMYGTIAEGWYELGEKDNMMTVVLKVLEDKGFTWNGTGGGSGEKDYTITYLAGITKDGQTLAEFTGGKKSGWMGTLNDWFVNESFSMFSVANGKLENNDVIRIVYTTEKGADVGSVWGVNDTSLASLTVSAGTLSPAFDGGTTEYTLVLPEGVSSVKVTPTPVNKNYQSRIFLNSYNQDSAMFKRTDAIPVKVGDVIYVGVGEQGWPTMNSGGKPTKYTIRVTTADGAVDDLDASKVNLQNYKTYAAKLASIDRDALTDAGKAKYDAVQSRIDFYQATDDLKAEIKALPGSVTAADKAAVDAAMEHYEALPEAHDLLTGAETNKLFKADNTVKLLAAMDKVAATKDFDHTEANTSGEVKTALESWLNGLGLGSGVTAAVTVDDCTAASASADGSYSATVTLSIGEGGRMASAEKSVTGEIHYIKSTDAGVKSITANGVNATGSGTVWSAVLPYGSNVATATVVVEPADGASASVPATADGGTTWTFTVTAEDGTTEQNYTLTLSVNDVITTAAQSSAYIVGNDAESITVTGLIEAVSTDALDLPVGASTVSVWLEVSKTAQDGDDVTVNVAAKYSVDGGAAQDIPDAALIGDATVTLPVAGTANARVLHGDEYLAATGSASGITFAARSGQYTLIPDALIASVTYHLNGGTATGLTDGQQIAYYRGDALTIPEAERSGYTLKGWYASADGSGSPVTAISAGMPGELWAIWQSSDASATVKVGGIDTTLSGTVFTISLPFGSTYPTAEYISITPAEGATASAPVTEDEGASWSFKVTAEDGTEKNYTLQVEIAEQTAAEKLTAAKAAIEAADWTVAQATANDATALKTFVEGKLAYIALDGATAAVTVATVTPAVAGTKDAPGGTDGSYGFTVALTLGEDSTTASVSNAKITATAYVPPTPPTVTWSEALAGVQAYVAEQVPNPGVGSTKGEWAVFALNRGGVATEDWNNKYLSALQSYVAEHDGVLAEKKYTEYSRVVIALTSLGCDATQFTAGGKTYDLVSPLLDKQNNGATWAEWQGNNGTCFALLALDSHNYLDNADGKAIRAALIASLKANQKADGGWPISGDTSDLDVTAAAVYALAPYYLDSSKLAALGGSVTYAEVKTMVDNALTFLSAKQNAQGGFGSPEADVWAIIALTTLGRDPATETAFVKDGGSLIDDLLRYYDETTGGFKHETDGSVNQMSSEQAAYGLVAYDRFKAGKTALYDMSDVEIAPNVPENPEEADRAAAAAVDELIDAIGTVTLESESAITAARTAYDALTATQKALVTKYATLTVAETKLTALKNKDNKPDKDKDKTITVTMRLIGAEKATKDVDLGKDSYLPNYVTWIPTTSYTLEKGSSVYDLWTVATADYGIRSVGAENNYVETVYAPSGYALSEFTNGPRSGWMYTINGRHPGFGLCEQELYDGDIVIWHYVNDYSYEVEDWFKDDPNYPALGDGTYWNLWLKAPDSTGGTGGGVAAGEGKKDDKKTEGSETTTDKNTITADDGSEVTVETERTVETKENEDGSVTETVTETTKTTVVAPDGSTSVTETAVETETTTNSVENSDGSVTETESTVEKVTETVTAADGTKQTTVTETEETKKVNTTTADGKTSGTGTYSAKTTVTGADGKKTTAVTEGNITVSTDDKGTVSEVTNAKTTTTAPDGSKTETVTVITEAEMTNGTTGKVVADGEGNTISAEATVSEAALEAAQKGDGVIEIPVTVNPDSGAAVRIHLPELAKGQHAWVEIGTTEIGSGNVAYLKLGDVTKLLSTCKTGSVIVPVTGDCEVIVKDNSKAFSDVDAAAWYGDSVKFVTAREIFNGNGDGTFAPGATMNRAMAAQILYNLDSEAKAGDGSRFSDVSAGDWFNGAVGWAAGLGVINGYDGAYAPLDAVTRQDLVTILYRYAKQAGFDVSAGRSVNLSAYADGDAVASYAAEAMRWAIGVGLVKGYEDNTLRPTATATRAEVAAIMQRMVQNAVK